MRDPIISIAPPPVSMMFDGPAEEFISNGQAYLGLYRKFGEITPQTRILDIGCGIGRKTIPLVNFLDATTLYLGIDCKHEGIRWCEENITKVAPNFVFVFDNIQAPGYNPEGRIAPEVYKFPISTQWDFIVANSVFTHMMYGGILNYLREMRKHLAPGGKIWTTWFITDRNRHEWPTVTQQLPYKSLHGRIQNANMPEQMIAYDWDVVQYLHEQVGLTIDNYLPGSWAGTTGIAYQDIIIATLE